MESFPWCTLRRVPEACLMESFPWCTLRRVPEACLMESFPWCTLRRVPEACFMESFPWCTLRRVPARGRLVCFYIVCLLVFGRVPQPLNILSSFHPCSPCLDRSAFLVCYFFIYKSAVLLTIIVLAMISFFFFFCTTLFVLPSYEPSWLAVLGRRFIHSYAVPT